MLDAFAQHGGANALLLERLLTLVPAEVCASQAAALASLIARADAVSAEPWLVYLAFGRCLATAGEFVPESQRVGVLNTVWTACTKAVGGDLAKVAQIAAVYAQFTQTSLSMRETAIIMDQVHDRVVASDADAATMPWGAIEDMVRAPRRPVLRMLY